MRDINMLILFDVTPHMERVLGPQFSDYKSIDPAVVLDKIPTICPICNRETTPHIKAYSCIEGNNSEIEIIYYCNLPNCGRLFLSRYSPSGKSTPRWKYIESYPRIHRNCNFDKDDVKISIISPMFVKIFNQASEAEAHGLSDIAGVGYRRALEFLVKDYLIAHEKKEAEIIKKKFLGKCIREDVDDSMIKKLADRAIWLGNDETHYERKWEDKDIDDLKKLINLTLHSIESKILAESYIKDMPEGKQEREKYDHP